VGYPYLYFAIPYKGYFNRTTCVEFCPNYTVGATPPLALTCKTNKIVTSCAENCLNPERTASKITYPPDSSLWDLNKFVCVFNSSISN
jgi:solute carrier family 44 protein 1 (choline transporter-like protein)/choline transporter-like protein 2/4/5